MADKKISALTSATTPLAGTEVLPIVQSGSTVKVAISDVTAGRAVSALSYTLTGTNINAPIGTNTIIGQTAATSHQAGNAGSVSLFIEDGGNPSGVFVTNTFDGTYSSQEVEIKTSQGGVTAATTQLKATKTGDIQISTGNVVIGTSGKGVNFTANTPAAGMTSQLLNWYEEGTWTPSQGAGLTVVGAFTSSGTYIRVGRLVTIFGTLNGSTSVATSSGGVITSGYPFTVATATAGVATNSNLIGCTTYVGAGGASVMYANAALTAAGSIIVTASYYV